MVLMLGSCYLAKELLSNVILETLFTYQTGLFIFFCTFLTGRALKTRFSSISIRAVTGLVAYVLILFQGGYLTIDLLSLPFASAEPNPLLAFLSAFILFCGNHLILGILSNTTFLQVPFGSFKFPLKGFLIISVLAIPLTFLTAIIQFRWIQLALSFLLALPLFLWAGFSLLDTHWKLMEFDRENMRKNKYA